MFIPLFGVCRQESFDTMADTIEIELSDDVASYVAEIAAANEWTTDRTVAYMVRAFAQYQIEAAAERNSEDGEVAE